jgi:hypothetical protein
MRRVRPGGNPHLDFKEGIMFDFISNRKNSVPRPSLYCVWIRAHDGENAPLIRVWIDPSMMMFESRAKVHEPDVAAACAEAVNVTEAKK